MTQNKYLLSRPKFTINFLHDSLLSSCLEWKTIKKILGVLKIHELIKLYYYIAQLYWEEYRVTRIPTPKILDFEVIIACEIKLLYNIHKHV